MVKRLVGSKLIRCAGVYTFSNILNQSIPFLLIPLLTRYLLPFDYGLVATFQVIAGFVAPFVGLSVHGAIARKYYDNDVDLPSYVTNCLMLLVVSSLVFSLLMWFFDRQVSTLTTFPKEWLWGTVVISIRQFVNQIRLSLWQVQVRPVPYGLYQISQTILNACFTVVFVVILDLKWQGWILANVIVSVLYFVVTLFLLWKDKWIKFSINPKYIESALKFGIPLIPHAIGGSVMMAIDRILINKMVGVADTGIYSVSYQVSMIIVLVQTSFNMAWVPWFYEKLKLNEFSTKLKIVKFTYLYVLTMVLFAIGLTLSAPLIMQYFVGKDFYGASLYIGWLSIGKAINAMYFMTCNYIFYSTKTAYLALATFVSAVVHSVMAYYLISFNGTMGAAQAGVVSSIVLVVLTWCFANRVHDMPWNLLNNKYALRP